MSRKIIGDYFDGEKEFDCCFWTTFTIDSTTIDFVHRQHIRPILREPHFHVMVDARSLDKVITSGGTLDGFSALAKKSIISTAYAKVAFHPKIILLGSDKDIKVIITSGNATPSGVLANIDLVAEYVFEKEAENNRNNGIIAEVFRFMLSFPNWNILAKDALGKIANLHPWLHTEKDPKVLTTEKGAIFQQIMGRVGAKKVSDINIYSPSFDPDLETVQQFKKTWPQALVNVWVGHWTLALNDNGLVQKLKSEGINIYCSAGLNKTKFHAKIYHFKFDDDTATVFWGSANCSRAALMRDDLSYELLIDQSDLKIDSIFTEVEKSELYQPEQVVPYLEEPEELFKVLILEANYQNGFLKIICNTDHNFKLKLIETSDVEAIVDLKCESTGIYHPDETLEISPLIISLIDNSGRTVSNSIVVNHPETVFNNKNKVSLDADQILQSSNSKALQEIDQYLEIIVGQDMNNSDEGSKVDGLSFDRRNMWALPSANAPDTWASPFSSSIGDAVDSSAEDEVPDDDLEPEEILAKQKRAIRKNKETVDSRDWFQSVRKKLTKKNEVLFQENKKVIIDLDQWGAGVEVAIQWIIKELDTIDRIYDEEIDLIAEAISELSRACVYITSLKLNSEKFSLDEKTKIRLNTFQALIELNIFFSKLRIVTSLIYLAESELQDADPNCILRNQYGLFLRDCLSESLQKINYNPISKIAEIIEKKTKPKILTKNCVNSAVRAISESVVVFQTLPNLDAKVGDGVIHKKYGNCLIAGRNSNRIKIISISIGLNPKDFTTVFLK